jgi:hypothetical protein
MVIIDNLGEGDPRGTKDIKEIMTDELCALAAAFADEKSGIRLIRFH